MDVRQERECLEILEGLPWFERVKFLWHGRWLLARQAVKFWLHRTRIALPWTYRLAEAE